MMDTNQTLVVAEVAAALQPQLDRLRAELAELRAAVARGDVPERPLSRARLAEALDCSERHVDHLRAMPGFPEHRLGDAPRFFLSEVSAWMRRRTMRGAA